MTNPLQDDRAYWSMRAGKMYEQMSREARDQFRVVMNPRKSPDRANVAHLADGQVLALWVAAAMDDPEWGERLVTRMVSRDDPVVQQMVREIRRVMTLALPNQP